jgi:hypothetical protein
LNTSRSRFIPPFLALLLGLFALYMTRSEWPAFLIIAGVIVLWIVSLILSNRVSSADIVSVGAQSSALNLVRLLASGSVHVARRY